MASLVESDDADIVGDSPEANAKRVAFLRARGVEVDLPEDRSPTAAAATGGGAPFAFVHIPANEHAAVAALSAAGSGGGGADSDVLPTLLAPRFADDAVLDADTVCPRASAARRSAVHAHPRRLRATQWWRRRRAVSLPLYRAAVYTTTTRSITTTGGDETPCARHTAVDDARALP